MTSLLSRRNRPAKAKMTLRRKAGITVCVIIVLAGLGVGLGSLVHYLGDAGATCMNQGLTIVTHEGASGECVGITDGAFQFDPAYGALVQVEIAIRAEDQRVRNAGPGYASVAYLMPISATGDVEPIQTAAEQLEGAYTAQYYANHNNVDGTKPLIQLLIASGGTQAAEYGTAVRDIESDVASQHLVAVAGIGISLDSTIAEVKKLADDTIPIFASSITSDAFDNIQNMVRVSPSNAQDVGAVLTYIKPRVATGFLIQDTNQADSYDTTIVSEFRNGFPDRNHHIVAIESYNTAGELSPNDPVGQAVANRIGQIPSDICYSQAGVVLFAGRGRELGTLLADLGSRPCLTTPITVVTGDDVTDMTITPAIEQGLATGVTLEYAGEANPGEWGHGSGAVFQQGQQGYSDFSKTFKSQFPKVLDNDGDAMMGYDAALTSISATRLAGPVPSPAAVIEELSALQDSRTVLGASGPIVLSGSYQCPGCQGSNPVGKVIPILLLSPRGTIEFKQLEQPPFAPVGGSR